MSIWILEKILWCQLPSGTGLGTAEERNSELQTGAGLMGQQEKATIPGSSLTLWALSEILATLYCGSVWHFKPLHYLHQSLRKWQRHCWRQMCWWGCHCDGRARGDSVVRRQHLHLRVGPYHNRLLLLFTGLQGAAGAHVLPGSGFSVSTRLIID